MLRSIKDLYGFAIGATDGDIGKVKECYFDDVSYTVRYIVVDTGGGGCRNARCSSRRSLSAPWTGSTSASRPR